MNRVVDGPAGDDRAVPGGGHDVEDVGLLQLEPPALAVATRYAIEVGACWPGGSAGG